MGRLCQEPWVRSIGKDIPEEVSTIRTLPSRLSGYQWNYGTLSAHHTSTRSCRPVGVDKHWGYLVLDPVKLPRPWDLRMYGMHDNRYTQSKLSGEWYLLPHLEPRRGGIPMCQVEESPVTSEWVLGRIRRETWTDTDVCSVQSFRYFDHLESFYLIKERREGKGYLGQE